MTFTAWIILTIIILIIIDINVLDSFEKTLIHPIKQKFKSCSTFYNYKKTKLLYQAYQGETSYDLKLHKDYLEHITPTSNIFLILIDSFIKLIYPLFTFIILFLLTSNSTLFQLRINKSDKDNAPTLIENFTKVINNIVENNVTSILLISLAVALLFVCTSLIHNRKLKIVELHKNLINRIIEEKKEEKDSLD
ncbi:UNVERIFIED_CONTAM: hypothetical protein ABIC26_001735 [Paenibacillus sp. PvR008]